MSARSFTKLAAGGLLCGAVHLAILGGTLFIAWGLFVVPRHWGVSEFFDQQTQQHTWFVFLSLPAFFAQIFAPFLFAGWFFQSCETVAERYFHPPIDTRPPERDGAPR